MTNMRIFIYLTYQIIKLGKLFLRDVEVNVEIIVCVNVVEQKLFSLNMVQFVVGNWNQLLAAPIRYSIWFGSNCFIFHGSIFILLFCRYCYRQYHVDGKGRNGGSKRKGVPMTCTLQNGYNVTAQDLQDNLFPLRPALVPAKSITCHIKKYVLIYL